MLKQDKILTYLILRGLCVKEVIFIGLWTFFSIKVGLYILWEVLCSLPCSVLDEFQVNCDQASTVGDHVLCPVYFPHQAVQDADIIVSSQL